MRRLLNVAPTPLIALIALCVAGAASAESREVDYRGPAAFLYAYVPKPGQESLFDAGYRRHLAWHTSHRDVLPWYGSYVGTGERTGTFIDGTFGISFAAFDRRIEPKSDAVDFAQNVAPFSVAAWRAVYVVRPELSTGQPLETRSPTQLVEVTQVLVEPGRQSEFERLLSAVCNDLGRSKRGTVLTSYQLVSGGAQPSYMIMIARNSWSEYHEGSSAALLIAASPLLQRALDNGRPLIRQITTETWSYRPDLSLIE